MFRAILSGMSKNKDTYVAKNLPEIIRNADAGTTVFADGSTYNNRDGYSSNGAPTLTRDSKPSPIVKKWRMKSETIINIVFALMMALLFGAMALSGIHVFKTTANDAAVVKEIESQGAEVVGNKINNDAALVRFDNDQILPCDVMYAMDDDSPKRFVACAQGENVLAVKVPYNEGDILDLNKYNEKKK